MSRLTADEIAAIEVRMRELPEPDLNDPDNPEWNEADFDRAARAEDLPQEDLAAFPNTVRRLGRPRKDAPKVAVSLRLDPDVLAYYRGLGAGWQARLNDVLRRSMTST